MTVEMFPNFVIIGREYYPVIEWIDYVKYIDHGPIKWKGIKWKSPTGVLCEYDAPEGTDFIVNEGIFK